MLAQKKLEQDLLILKSAIEHTADHVMITDKDGVIQYVNPAFETTTGYTKHELLGKNPKVLQSGKEPLEYYRNLWATILAGKTFHAQTTNKKKNGELYIADQTISPIKNESGEIVNFVSIWKDVTEKVRLEESLRIEKQKLEEIVGFDEKISAIRKSEKLMDFVVAKTRKILEAKKCSIMLIDSDTGELCMKASEGFTENMGSIKVKISESIAGKVVQDGQPLLVKDIEFNPDLRFSPKSAYVGRSFMIAPIKREGDVIGVINVADKYTHFNQDDIFNEIDLKILCDIAREVAVALENVKFYKELQYLTITDPLTSIHNFRHFTNSLEYELKRLKRLQGEMGLIMIDIDNFKFFNDQFGHPAGDQLLKDIGKIIQENLREIDVFCRYAGDEFVIILPGTDKIGSAILSERIRKSIARAKFKMPVTVSIGAAQYKRNMTKQDLTSKADRALYEAKKEGKKRICIYG